MTLQRGFNLWTDIDLKTWWRITNFHLLADNSLHSTSLCRTYQHRKAVSIDLFHLSPSLSPYLSVYFLSYPDWLSISFNHENTRIRCPLPTPLASLPITVTTSALSQSLLYTAVPLWNPDSFVAIRELGLWWHILGSHLGLQKIASISSSIVLLLSKVFSLFP